MRRKMISTLLAATLVIALAVSLPIYLLGNSPAISPNNTQMLLKGHVIIQLNGDIVREFDNLITNVGLDAIGACISDATNRPAVFDYIGVGEGTTVPSKTDTDLEDPLGDGRLQGTYTNLAEPGEWQVKAVFPPGTAVGAITESGVFNANIATGGTLLCRQTFPVVNKGVGDTLEITWKFTLVQAP
ncbi:hypothetical protein ACFLXE_03955 [Chloroflexota bacterium]